ncbi:RNase H domain-containing protein [Trichonephila clavipes]|nr:RNase H domain-containing protein [Trichonephila clavipes]
MKKRNESQNLREGCSTEGELLMGSISVFLCSFQYASTHHGAQQGEAARRSSDMRQARHLPQRWYWSIVVQVRDVIRQFTQGTPNCNTNPKATVFGIPKEPVLESAELITSRLTGAGSLLPPVYGEAWAKGHATGTPDSTFPREKEKITRVPRERETRTHLKKVSPLRVSWGADRTSLLRVYHAIVLSCIDYGCVAYGSACNSTLQKLDPVHHMALRICSGAFRTSPVQSLYVNCHQLPLDLRRRKLSLAFYFKILSMPSHPLQNVYMSTSMKRLYDARPSNIRPFMDRMKLHISELDLPNVRIQQRNLFLFQPWNTPRFHYINPFATYSKSTVAPVVFQRVFAYHRSQYSRYSAIYTDGSKRADYVGCGVVIEDIMHGYRLDTSCSIFTAEAVAIYRALQLIDSTMPRKYCIYTDSMSVLEALENYHDRCHPVVCTYSTLRVDSTARVSISCFAGYQVTMES